MTRRRRWIIALLATFIVALAAFALLGYLLLLPWIVRQQVAGAFRRAGISRVSFDVRGSSLYQSDVTNLSAGEGDLLKIGGIAVRYSPRRALRGRLDSITISNARIIIDLDHPPALEAPTTARTAPSRGISLPFDKLELISSALVLRRHGRDVLLPLSGTLAGASADSNAMLTLSSAIGASPLTIQGTVNPASGDVELRAAAPDAEVGQLLPLLPAGVGRSIKSASGTFGFDARYARRGGEQDATLQLGLRDGAVDMSDALDAKASGIGASVALDRLLALASPAGQTVTIAELVASGAKLTDVRMRFHVNGPHDLAVEELRAQFAGGDVRVEPFRFDFANPIIATTVLAEHLGVGETVALVTQGKGTGSGRFSGSVPITIDFSRAASGDAVTLGDGSLTAEPGGNLRLGEATSGFQKMLERSNPAFAEPEMADIKNDILEAVQDFDYDLLEVKLGRKEGQDQIALHLLGRGRGAGRVPLDLRVEIEGGSILLNDYLALKSRVFSTGTSKASP